MRGGLKNSLPGHQIVFKHINKAMKRGEQAVLLDEAWDLYVLWHDVAYFCGGEHCVLCGHIQG